MKRNEETEVDEKDEILRELWKVKDYYSLSCHSDFEVLVRKVREDVKDFIGSDADGKQNKMAALS